MFSHHALHLSNNIWKLATRLKLMIYAIQDSETVKVLICKGDIAIRGTMCCAKRSMYRHKNHVKRLSWLPILVQKSTLDRMHCFQI